MIVMRIEKHNASSDVVDPLSFEGGERRDKGCFRRVRDKVGRGPSTAPPGTSTGPRQRPRGGDGDHGRDHQCQPQAACAEPLRHRHSHCQPCVA